MTSTDQKQTFIQLRAQGVSYSRIAKQLGKSKQTLISWSKSLEDEIANLRAIELESLREQYRVTKKVKLRMLGNQLQRIEKEIESRDLASVPTEKLMDLQFKLAGLIDQEGESVAFRGSANIADPASMFDLKHEWHG